MELTNSSAKITWNEVEGSIFISYNISLNSTYGNIFEFTTNENFMQFNSLTCNTAYSVTIFAFNSAGSGEISKPMTFITRKKS